MADYAIHDTTLICTSNIIRKKEGSSALIDPADYPKRINLMGMLEEKTASSSPVCAFEDGADDVPSSSVKVTIPATLSGVSSVGVEHCGANLFPFPIADYWETGDINATTGETEPNEYNTRTKDFLPVSATTIYVSGVTNSGSSDKFRFFFYASDKSFISRTNYSNTESVTVPSNAVWFKMRYQTASGSFSNPSIFEQADQSYQPYTKTTYTANLGRTIYGGSADIVNGTGTATWKKIVADGVNVKATGGYASGANRLPTIQVSDAVTTPTDIKADYLTTTSSVIGTEDSILLGNSGTSIVLHIGTIQGNDGTHGYSSDAELLSACNSYLADHNLTIVYKLSDVNTTDFTFDGQEVPTRLGYNAFWSDEGDTEVTYRSSGTITPVPIVPTLISKTITENGTYDAEDDDADGYSSVTVNVEGVPSGDHDDPLGIMTDYTRLNVSNLYSAYYIGNGELKKEVVFQMASGSGYEGFCISLDGLNLTDGTQYTLSFVLDVPTGVTFSGSYPWGIKYSSARVPASGSANTNTFNITPTVNFVEQTGSQNVSITFTAGQTNYLLVLLARIAGSNTSWITMRDVKIEEVLP